MQYPTDSLVPLKWMQAVAWICAVTALLGLALISFSANAEDETAPGIQPGVKPFGNPFSDSPIDDEPMDEAPPSPTPSPTPSAAPSRSTPPRAQTPPAPRSSAPRSVQAPRPSSVPPDTSNTPSPKLGPKGVSVGGDTPMGLTTASEEKPMTFPVDTDSGAGSNALVTDFNYPDISILDLAKTMGKLTGKNFIFDKDVKGNISIVSNSPVTIADAWRAFLTALDSNGFTILQSGKYLRISKSRDARDRQVSVYTGANSPSSDILITRIFPLKHIGAEEASRTMRNFASLNAKIIPYAQTNSLIVTDTGSTVSKLAKMLEFLDVEGYDAGIEVIEVKHASAVELAKLIDALLPDSDATTPGRSTGARPRPAGGSGSANFTARRTKEGGIVDNVIADERSNSLIVHANPKGVEQVRKLVDTLDRDVPAAIGGGNLHVIYLQFADAEEIAKTINTLSSAPQKAPTGSTGASRPGGAAGGVGTNPKEDVVFEGAIRVSPDKATNSLVVTATPADFATLERVIEKLDVARDEVYVEAVIMEMQVGDDFQWSSNVAFPKFGIGSLPNPKDFIGWLANPASQSGAVLGFRSGKEYPEIKTGESTSIKLNSVTGLVRFLQGETNATVLATPQILTLDNSKAVFESGEKIPVQKSTLTATGTETSIDYKNIGLTLEITPQINKTSDFVKLEIKAKIEEQTNNVPAKLQDLAVSSSERRAETTVIVPDSDTVVLGGLVRDKKLEQTAKVPILGDIPLLGWLFKSKTDITSKTNLVMFITPKIIRKNERLREILHKKLSERQDFINDNAGGEDPLKQYTDKLTAELPVRRNGSRSDLDSSGSRLPTAPSPKNEDSLDGEFEPLPDSDALPPPPDLAPDSGDSLFDTGSGDGGAPPVVEEE